MSEQCSTTPVPPGRESPLRSSIFSSSGVDDAIAGAAFVEVADVDGDTQLDLVVSSFGTLAGPFVPAGQVRVYTRNGALDDWSFRSVVAEADNVAFPNHATVTDVDGDLDMDVIVPSGFLACALFGPACGRLAWYEQDAGAFTAHEIVPAGSALFYHHAEIVDFDRDGIDDLVTVGEQFGNPMTGDPARAETQWFKGTGDGYETRVLTVGSGLGSFPRSATSTATTTWT